MVHPSAEEPAEQVARAVIAGEDVGGVVAVARPQAQVDVAAAARLVGLGLRHERHRDSLLLGEFLHRLLQQYMAVGHRQRVGVADVEFVLPDGGLALRVLDRDLRLAQRPSCGADVVLDPSALQQVVVLVVPTGRRQVGVALVVGLAVAVAVEEELELARRLDGETRLRRPLSTCARRIVRGATGTRSWFTLSCDVAEHDRRSGRPAAAAQGGEVGDEVEVAVAALPVGVGVALDRFHLHVDGEQVVAGVASGRRASRGRSGRRTACPSSARSGR